jgi:hypothetical protein
MNNCLLYTLPSVVLSDLRHAFCVNWTISMRFQHFCNAMRETHPYISEAGEDWKAYSNNRTLCLFSWSRPTSRVLHFHLSSVFWSSCPVWNTFLQIFHWHGMGIRFGLYRAMSRNGTSCVIISMFQTKWLNWKC